jgi:hypothetical protein
MAHISSIGAGMFSDLSVCRDAVPGTLPTNSAGWQALFATELANGAAGTATVGEFTRIKNVREFPSMGTPPNIVNVPVYGQATSQQIQGQSDAPSMEIQLNLIGTDWQDAENWLGSFVGDGMQYVFRFTLANSEPTGSGVTKWSSTAGGLGTIQNSQWYWVGKMEAFLVNPQLTDANTGTLTLSVQSDFYGAYTTNGA